MKYLLALDQGTTSSRAILFSLEGRPVAMAQREFRQLYPRPGWVEHDPLEIWESQLGVAQEVLRQAGVETREVVALASPGGPAGPTWPGRPWRGWPSRCWTWCGPWRGRRGFP
ncbi:hypothetical protein Thermus77412_13350 [Thermus antranikianii]